MYMKLNEHGFNAIDRAIVIINLYIILYTPLSYFLDVKHHQSRSISRALELWHAYDQLQRAASCSCNWTEIAACTRAPITREIYLNLHRPRASLNMEFENSRNEGRIRSANFSRVQHDSKSQNHENKQNEMELENKSGFDEKRREIKREKKCRRYSASSVI